MKKLNYTFFERKSAIVAKDLLGKYLVLSTGKEKLIGKIVETEAYHQNDPASHSYKGLTLRNRPMFGPPGFAYVYFIYGIHYCFNIVTEPVGIGGAVLIRALEPIAGIETMQKNRRLKDIKYLTNGPAKLTEAFGINKKYNGKDLIKEKINIYEKEKQNFKIIKTSRIGITQAKNELLRFYIKDNKFVSKI